MLSDVIAFLQSWKIIALPTETVYGLAVDATNDDAVSSLFALKLRPLDKPLTIQLWDIDDISRYANIVDPMEQKLIDTFMPGPLTIVLRKRSAVSDVVTAGREYVGIRIPSHPIALELLQSIDFPLAVPSANRSAETPAKTMSEVQEMFGDSVEYYIPNNQQMAHVASTVVQVVNRELVILREGIISLDMIRKSCY